MRQSLVFFAMFVCAASVALVSDARAEWYVGGADEQVERWDVSYADGYIVGEGVGDVSDWRLPVALASRDSEVPLVQAGEHVVFCPEDTNQLYALGDDGIVRHRVALRGNCRALDYDGVVFTLTVAERLYEQDSPTHELRFTIDSVTDLASYDIFRPKPAASAALPIRHERFQDVFGFENPHFLVLDCIGLGWRASCDELDPTEIGDVTLTSEQRVVLEESLELYEDWSRRDPTNPWLIATRAAIIERLGDAPRALAVLREVLEIPEANHTDLLRFAPYLDQYDLDLGDEAFDRGLAALRRSGYRPSLVRQTNLPYLWFEKPLVPLVDLDAATRSELDVHVRHARRLARFAPRGEDLHAYFTALADTAQRLEAPELANELEEMASGAASTATRYTGTRVEHLWFWFELFNAARLTFMLLGSIILSRLLRAAFAKWSAKDLRAPSPRVVTRTLSIGAAAVALITLCAVQNIIVIAQTNEVIDDAPSSAVTGDWRHGDSLAYVDSIASMGEASALIREVAKCQGDPEVVCDESELARMELEVDWARSWEEQRSARFGPVYDVSALLFDEVLLWVDRTPRPIDLRVLKGETLAIWVILCLLIVVLGGGIALRSREDAVRAIPTRFDRACELIPGVSERYGVSGPLLTLLFAFAGLELLYLVGSGGRFYSLLFLLTNVTRYERFFGVAWESFVPLAFGYVEIAYVLAASAPLLFVGNLALWVRDRVKR